MTVMLVIIVVIVVIVIIAIIELLMLMPTVVTPQVLSQRCYGHLDFLDKAKDALAKARHLPVTSADLGSTVGSGAGSVRRPGNDR